MPVSTSPKSHPNSDPDPDPNPNPYPDPYPDPDPDPDPNPNQVRTSPKSALARAAAIAMLRPSPRPLTAVAALTPPIERSAREPSLLPDAARGDSDEVQPSPTLAEPPARLEPPPTTEPPLSRMLEVDEMHAARVRAKDIDAAASLHPKAPSPPHTSKPPLHTVAPRVTGSRRPTSSARSVSSPRSTSSAQRPRKAPTAAAAAAAAASGGGGHAAPAPAPAPALPAPYEVRMSAVASSATRAEEARPLCRTLHQSSGHPPTQVSSKAATPRPATVAGLGTRGPLGVSGAPSPPASPRLSTPVRVSRRRPVFSVRRVEDSFWEPVHSNWPMYDADLGGVP